MSWLLLAQLGSYMVRTIFEMATRSSSIAATSSTSVRVKRGPWQLAPIWTTSTSRDL